MAFNFYSIMTFIFYFYQIGRGHWIGYYTSPQRFLMTFSYYLAQQLWGNFIEFWLIGSQSWVSKRFNQNFTDGIILCIIIGDIHIFVGHCLIHLNPWFLVFLDLSGCSSSSTGEINPHRWTFNVILTKYRFVLD